MVGTAGFEPTTPTPPVWCATWLRYAPIYFESIRSQGTGIIPEYFSYAIKLVGFFKDLITTHANRCFFDLLCFKYAE